jgi:trehalose-6-phosphate synthase
MSHVSIEPEKLENAMLNPVTLKITEEIKQKYKNKKIILGSCLFI